MNENLNQFTLSNRQPNIEWFCMTVIVTVLALIVLRSLLPSSSIPSRRSSPANPKWFIGNISRMQQGYYLENDHFATSRQQLGGLWLEHIENNWEISIQIKDNIAFTYAVAKSTNPNQKMYSYVAAATAYDKNDNNQFILCRTLEPSTAQPAAPILQESQQFIFWRIDAKLVCSSGTEDCYRNQKIRNWIREALSENLPKIRWLHPFNLSGNE